MIDRFGASLAAAAALLSAATFSSIAVAAELPGIKVSESNPVPDCATPGRLMAYIQAQNGKIDAKFDGIATEYMRHGEDLKIRWDIAFFQMMVETANLAYTGDVKPDQNNFAGLGATGGGVRGEKFKDVPTGARAHLEHILMYSGEKIENPAAERTKNIQEWGVLTSWQKTIKGPMTYTQLARQWAPTSKGYSTDIKFVADRFYNGACKAADPKPELVAEARGETAQAKLADTKTEPGKGAEIARRAIEDARAEGNPSRSGLGASNLAKAAETTAVVPATETKTASPAITLLNPSADDPAVLAADSVEPPKTGAAAEKPAVIEAASVAMGAKSAGKPDKPERSGKSAAATPGKCKVWQASYGGGKAIIIKAKADQQTNYTVLDVNDGSEKREAEAYITAYAKGGETVGEFPSQTQALDKAFELCPEG